MQNAITQSTPRRPDRKQLVLASVLGLAAAVLVVVFLNKADDGKSSATSEVMVPVLVASEPIKVGSKISDTQIAVKQLPSSAVTTDAIKDQTQVVGQVARYPIAQGDQIGASRLIQA